MRGNSQDIIQRCACGLQNHFDTLQGVVGLLTDAFADLSGDGVPPGLAGHEDQVAKPGSWGQIGIGRSEIYLNGFFLRHTVSPSLPTPPKSLRRQSLTLFFPLIETGIRRQEAEELNASDDIDYRHEQLHEVSVKPIYHQKIQKSTGGLLPCPGALTLSRRTRKTL